jgi:crotonobetainyl-CoA:carnitine CoA-transferase CaiB-like acyl-CoA transferase
VMAALDAARIAYGLVATVADLVAHPSAVTLPVETDGGPVDVLAPPVIVDGARPKLGAVPALGRDDQALRAEFMPKG